METLAATGTGRRSHEQIEVAVQLEAMDNVLPVRFPHREQFDAWLGTPEDAQRKRDRLRLHILMLLRRMPPDRNFQRWLSRR